MVGRNRWVCSRALRLVRKIATVFAPVFVVGGCAVAVTKICLAASNEGVAESCAAAEDLSQQVARMVTASDVFAEKRDLVSSNRKIQAGIDVIGVQYINEGALDDTGMKLVLSMSEERAGRMEIARNLRRKVLVSRLEMYRAKLGCGAGNQSKPR